MSKIYDLSVSGIGTVVTSSNLYGAEYDRFQGLVNSEKVAAHLAAITTSDKTSDALGVAKAYHAAMIDKVSAKQEGFKNETELLMSLTGLGKASISMLRKVGKLFMGDNSEFIVPEELRGYTVTQIYELISKSKEELTAADFAVIASECGINSTTSAKDIRERMKDKYSGTTAEERKASRADDSLKAAINKVAKKCLTASVYDVNWKEVGKAAFIDVECAALSEEQIDKLNRGDFTLEIHFI